MGWNEVMKMRTCVHDGSVWLLLAFLFLLVFGFIFRAYFLLFPVVSFGLFTVFV